MPFLVLRGLFLLLAGWLLLAAWAQGELRRGLPPGPPPARILILHPPGAELQALAAANLAGRFGRALRRESDGSPVRDAGRFDLVLLLGGGPAAGIPPDRLLAAPLFDVEDEAAVAPLAAALAARLARPGEPARALLRIDGIDGNANPRRLRALAELLRAQGAPFLLGVGDPAAVAAQPLLVAALDDARRGGGTLLARAPRDPEAIAGLADRWRAAGLEPPPLVALPNEASPGAARAARGGFAARHERPVYHEEGGGGRATPWLPWPTVDARGDYLLPDLPPGGAAENLPGGLVTLAFHWSEPPARLRAALRELRSRGIAPVSAERLLAEAPVHAPAAPRRFTLAATLAPWARALPRFDRASLVALLALVVASWLAGEAALARIGGGRRRRPAPQYVGPAMRRASA